MRDGRGPATGGSTGRRRRAGRLHHLLVGLVLLVAFLGVVGMHQLSVGHELATAPAHGHPYGPSATTAGTAAPAIADPADGMAMPADGSRTGDGHGCGEHGPAFGSCLLALTLLVLVWTLAPPRVRPRPPLLLPRLAPASARAALGRLVPALSPTELSLLRT